MASNEIIYPISERVIPFDGKGIMSSKDLFMTPKIKKEIERITYMLNTSLTQFTSSKTYKALEYIKHCSVIARANRGPQENGIHHMTIILTNNNLVETGQWKTRVTTGTSEFGMNCYTLSSKKDSSFNKVDQIIASLVKAKSANSLPDIIVMCTHGARTSDVIALLIELQYGNYDFSRIGIHQITTSVMFDEADKNIGLISDFLKDVNKEILLKNTVLRDIHFITATPSIQFWKKMKKGGINELDNIHHYLRSEEIMDYNHEELSRNYRSINEHCIRNDIDILIDNPIHYAETVLSKILTERSSETPHIVFAPAKVEKSSHYAMADMFHAKEFAVLLLNGDQKGFQYPDRTFESIEDFNKSHKINGELYHTLVAWRAIHKHTDLAITGYECLGRGVTFCTNGFNFTDMIISNYHSKNRAELVQILGRGTGNKAYVQRMNIWCPKKVIDDANEEIDILNQLLTRDPEVLCELDFRKKTTKEIREPALTVPNIVHVSDDNEWTAITKKKGRGYDEQYILSFISKQNPELGDELQVMTKKQISMPDGDNSYKKHILDFVKAAQEGKNFSIDIGNKIVDTDIYQIFLDNKEKRLIITRYYGTKLKK